MLLTYRAYFSKMPISGRRPNDFNFNAQKPSGYSDNIISLKVLLLLLLLWRTVIGNNK